MTRRSGLADRPFPRRSGGLRRRTFLAASCAALAGCSGLQGGAAYEREDVDVSLTAGCAEEGGEEVVVTLSWEWAGSDGGSAPDDVALIYWDDEKWAVRVEGADSSDGVTFEEPRTDGDMRGARFRHDDAAADGGTAYSASVALSPAGDFDPETRNVYGKFVHVRDEAERTERTGWFGDVEADWDAGVANSEAGSACEDAGG